MQIISLIKNQPRLTTGNARRHSNENPKTKQKMTRQFTLHVKPKELQVDDFVLQKNEATGKLEEKAN